MSHHPQSVPDAADTGHDHDEDEPYNPWMDFEPCVQRPHCRPADLVMKLCDNTNLVPLESPQNDVNSPNLLSADELNIIAPGIAQITLQGFCGIEWSSLYFDDGVSYTILIPFRQKLFKTLAKLVLTLFDLEDFQRCLVEFNIIRSCRLLSHHLSDVYGTEPGCFHRAMTDISQGKLDFSQFPFLWEQDLGFTLEFFEAERNAVKRLNLPDYVLRWPFCPPLIDKDLEGDDGLGRREQWTEVLSWEPRAFLYHNFLVSLFRVFTS